LRNAHFSLDAFVVRKAGKAHGLQRRIEGPDVAGRRVLAVEDTSTTGNSVLTAVAARRADRRDRPAVPHRLHAHRPGPRLAAAPVLRRQPDAGLGDGVARSTVKVCRSPCSPRLRSTPLTITRTAPASLRTTSIRGS
jgi:Orotate phosphoribosyltransferase